MTRIQAMRKTRLAAPRLHAQRGQAMIFTLMFAGVIALIALMLYNSGMLANTKTQLQNAADAGAYSGAVLLARDHNFSAYTNRAMVANQVSVAQLVSLKSYSEDAAATHRRMTGQHAGWAQVIPVFKPQWIIARAMPMPAIASAYASVAPRAVQALDRLIAFTEEAQGMHHNATILNVGFIADEVVKRNDPKASVPVMAFSLGHMAIQIKAWDKSTDKHSANNNSRQADRFANVVVNRDSTDELIRDRSSVLLAGWTSMSSVIACPPPAIPVATIYGFRHKGGTLLSRNKRRWLALDATQGGGGVSCLTPVGIPFGYPLLQDGAGGSGGGLAGSRGGYGNDRNGFSGNPSETRSYGDALNGLTSIPAGRRFRSTGPGNTMDAAGGLQGTYRDMADPTNAANRPANQSAQLNGAKVPFTIEVRHAAADIRTSSKVVGSAAATVNAQETLKGDTMKTLSSGAAFFYRSNTDSSAFTKSGWARGDRRTELANLFNPYWQAQLVENPDAALIMSIGLP